MTDGGVGGGVGGGGGGSGGSGQKRRHARPETSRPNEQKLLPVISVTSKVKRGDCA